jgi:CRP/FNR family cyclic AMP-dependent transcriptional regulator
MPEFQPISSTKISAIKRPRCPACRHKRMLLSRLETNSSGFGVGTFECQKCGCVHTTAISGDPMTSRARLARGRIAAAHVGLFRAWNCFPARIRSERAGPRSAAFMSPTGHGGIILATAEHAGAKSLVSSTGRRSDACQMRHNLRQIAPLIPGPFWAGQAWEKPSSAMQKNQKIYSQGDAADTVFFIQKGKVKITVLSEHGKEAVVAIFAEGQFFGEGCLEGTEFRAASSQAMEDCLITSITRSEMQAALAREPKFSEFFIAYLLSRNSRIEDDLIDQLFNSSERRLARLLLLLANFGEEGAAGPIAITLSQETLAEMIGTTRSRVSFFMNKFRKKGYIDYNGKIEVHRSLLDAVLREKPEIDEDD